MSVYYRSEAAANLNTMFNHYQLRKGDFVLVNDPPFKNPIAAEVIKTFGFNGLAVRFSDGRQRYFCSRKGYSDIVAGARPDTEGNYLPL